MDFFRKHERTFKVIMAVAVLGLIASSFVPFLYLR